MSHLRKASLACVRGVIARAIVRDRASISETLGDVTLRPAQRDAAARLSSLIALHGGAMLAEPVGLGKTFTALAVAAASHERLMIIAPAALRGMWTQSLEACGVRADIVSHESLSRGVTPRAQADLIIVDEAHRFRTPETQRYALLADVCRVAKVLLVTATPVQNRRADLAAQLALFLGRAAFDMTDAALTEFVVRESSCEPDGQPRLSGPHAVSLAVDDDCLNAILALPPPVPAKDESIAETLMTYGLVHQWTSSRAALIASLERRRARGLALIAAVDAGRRPTRKELSAWTFTGDSLQLAFAEMVVAAADEPAPTVRSVREALDRHDIAIADLLRRLRTEANSDLARALALRRIREAHPGERVIAFCHYTETVNALRSHLIADEGVAALTAHGARVAGGRISRDDVLVQFTPSGDTPQVKPAEHISLLITTDLLSEGLNLQEASVVVHLDLPWNPARLEQRVGRARRLGSRHDVVTVYAINPPVSAERLLRIHDRLCAKIAAASKAIGASPPTLPSLALTVEPTRGLAEEAGLVAAALREWLPPIDDVTVNPDMATDSTPGFGVFAVAEAEVGGYLALVVDDRRLRMIASFQAVVDTSSTSLLRAVHASRGNEAAATDDRLSRALDEIDAWIAARRGAAAVDARAVVAADSHRASLSRIARTLAAAPRHQRSRLAPLADAARRAATARISEGAERVLETIVQSKSSGEAWLQSLAEFGDRYARSIEPNCVLPNGAVLALILLQPRHSAPVNAGECREHDFQRD